METTGLKAVLKDRLWKDKSENLERYLFSVACSEMQLIATAKRSGNALRRNDSITSSVQRDGGMNESDGHIANDHVKEHYDRGCRR